MFILLWKLSLVMGKKRDISLWEIAFNGGIESFSPFALGLPTDKRYRHLISAAVEIVDIENVYKDQVQEWLALSNLAVQP